ncbi:hypothetical protein [Yoonia algicola]|uniref:Uncharacterized protein n=1 Tax=Yoonia algicola TaxID=3137368 RepID=A0AAN0M496_9RHOB
MPNEENVISFKPTYDLEKIRRLETALIEYVERYGLTDSARDALKQLEDIQAPLRDL